MRSVRVFKNVATNYLRFVLAALISLVLTPFLVHHLMDRDYGLWVTVFSLTGYFGLLDQGIRPSLVRYVSRDHAAGDREGLSRTISSALVLYTIVGAVTMAVAALVAVNSGVWIRVDPALQAIAPKLVLIVGATIALGFPMGVFGAVLSGLQRYDVANGIGMAIGIVRAVLFIAVVVAGGGLLALAWTSLGVNLFGHVWAWWAARKLLPEVRVAPQFVSKPYVRRILSYGGWAILGGIAANIAFQTDSIVITAFLGASLVTPFSLAAGLVDNARQLVYSAAFVLAPTASELDTLGERGKLHAMLVSGSRYSVLVSWPVLLGLIVFGPNLLTTWVGPQYASAALLLTILSVPTMASLPQAVGSSVLFGISKHRGVVLLSMASAVANLGLSLWWVKYPGLMRAIFGTLVHPGLVGVAMGTAVPLFLFGGIGLAWISCRALEMPAGRYLRDGLLVPGLVSLAFLVPAIPIQLLWHPLGWMPILGTCAGSWLVFALACWAWGIPPSDRQRWARMFRGLLGRPAAAAQQVGP